MAPVMLLDNPAVRRGIAYAAKDGVVQFFMESGFLLSGHFLQLFEARLVLIVSEEFIRRPDHDRHSALLNRCVIARCTVEMHAFRNMKPPDTMERISEMKR